MLGQIECHNRFFEGHVLHHLYHRATIVVSVSGSGSTQMSAEDNNGTGRCRVQFR